MEDKKLISTGGAIFDVCVTLLFWVFMSTVCAEHAPPSTCSSTKLMVGAFTAVPIAGTCWLGLSLFRVTLVDTIRRRRQGKDY